jgi:hypothetical protein
MSNEEIRDIACVDGKIAAIRALRASETPSMDLKPAKDLVEAVMRDYEPSVAAMKARIARLEQDNYALGSENYRLRQDYRAQSDRLENSQSTLARVTRNHDSLVQENEDLADRLEVSGDAFSVLAADYRELQFRYRKLRDGIHTALDDAA